MASTKQNYRVRQRLEVFYTGGAVRLSADGRLLACACADEVKVVDAASGAVVQTLPGVSACLHGANWQKCCRCA
jgi:U3 small nucleolar RNA-associated protein 13